jgi:hypothetical protein
MNKKQTRGMKVVTLIVIFILGLFLVFNCDNKGPSATTQSGDQKMSSINNTETTQNAINEPRWVTADAGLKLRSGPGTDYDTITVIPYAEKVNLSKEEEEVLTIGGVKGKWSEVRWKNNDGWVFGGFLAKEEITAVPNNFTEPFMWNTNEKEYYLIFYPNDGWEVKKSKNTLRLTNNTAQIFIPQSGIGLEGEDIDYITEETNIGKNRDIPVERVTWSQKGVFFLQQYRVASSDEKYNSRLNLNIGIWSFNNGGIGGGGLLGKDLRVFEQIAATLEILTEAEAKEYLENLETRE